MVLQAPRSSPEGDIVASLQEEVALMRCKAVGSRRGTPGDGSTATVVTITEVQGLLFAPTWGRAEGMFCGPEGPEWGT